MSLLFLKSSINKEENFLSSLRIKRMTTELLDIPIKPADSTMIRAREVRSKQSVGLDAS